ncbi:hypothetical protein SRIMM317S_06576 [Streptomyces rimosus subsp. rimosus]
MKAIADRPPCWCGGAAENTVGPGPGSWWGKPSCTPGCQTPMGRGRTLTRSPGRRGAIVTRPTAPLCSYRRPHDRQDSGTRRLGRAARLPLRPGRGGGAAQGAAAEGRLDLDELEERLEQALTAKTFADLAPLTADLPPPPPTGPGRAAGPQGRFPRRRPYGTLAGARAHHRARRGRRPARLQTTECRLPEVEVEVYGEMAGVTVIIPEVAADTDGITTGTGALRNRPPPPAPGQPADPPHRLRRDGGRGDPPPQRPRTPGAEARAGEVGDVVRRAGGGARSGSASAPAATALRNVTEDAVTGEALHTAVPTGARR